MAEPKAEPQLRSEGLRSRIMGGLIKTLFRLLRATWRIDEGPLPEACQKQLEAGQPLVYAHLHEDEWALLAAFADRKMHVLVSLSQDGGIMARFLEGLGFQVCRGSSSRGGAAGLIALIRAVKKSSAPRMVSLAVDGPRGPRREAKAGVFKLAEHLDAPVVLGVAYASRAWIFRRSWSKAFIPKPFARVWVSYPDFFTSQEVAEAARDPQKQAQIHERMRQGWIGAKALAKTKLK